MVGVDEITRVIFCSSRQHKEQVVATDKVLKVEIRPLVCFLTCTLRIICDECMEGLSMSNGDLLPRHFEKGSAPLGLFLVPTLRDGSPVGVQYLAEQLKVRKYRGYCCVASFDQFGISRYPIRNWKQGLLYSF
ncbi:hypothetical protein N7470_003866 [Penicillium chermesinum]|nr:hypothetical protein N7470_003866 [Penicillium chermesinum]